MIFQNRIEAGDMLAGKIRDLPLIQPIVLAIPRGGVPVGAAIAKALACPFDVIPLVKIPIPWSPEASYGVVAMDGTMALNTSLVNSLELSDRELELASDVVLEEARMRNRRYRGSIPFPELTGRFVILADDGMASGYSMLAAISFVKKRAARGIIVASPVASDAARRLIHAEQGIDALILLAVDSEPFLSLDSYYREFATLTDEDIVRELTPA